MMTVRATAAGPWGPEGTEFRFEEPTHTQQHYLNNGTLVEVEYEPDMTPKQRAVARAEALGLSTEGTQKEIEARIAEHEAVPEPPDEPS